VLGLNRNSCSRLQRGCFTARGLIRTYHRITDVAAGPWSLAESPRNFAEQLEVLRKYGRVMPLPQMVSWLEYRSSPGRALRCGCLD